MLDYSTIIDPLLQDVRIYTAALLSAQQTQNVLDVCCGTGDQVFHYAHSGLFATGIDENHTMILQAERKRHRHGFNDTDFYLAHATELPFRDGHFDSASLSLGLHEMSGTEQDNAVSEMKRVVKNGGTLIFIDFRVPFPTSPGAFLIRTVEFLAGKDNYRCFSNYLSQGGLAEILRRNHLRPQKQATFKLGLLEVIKTNNPWLIA